jgi:bacterioferritin
MIDEWGLGFSIFNLPSSIFILLQTSEPSDFIASEKRMKKKAKSKKKPGHQGGKVPERRGVQRRSNNRRAAADFVPVDRRNGGERRQTDRRKTGHFLSDIQELRRRARQHIEEGAITPGYLADREKVIAVLNEALATEIVCVLRYKRHYFMANGIHANAVADEFLEHANDEQGHADQIAERITQLGGAPNFNPEGLASRSHSQYVEGDSLVDMIREDLVAERIAIESYGEIVRFLGERDITSRRLMEQILGKEEEHADDLKNLLATLDPTKPGD